MSPINDEVLTPAPTYQEGGAAGVIKVDLSAVPDAALHSELGRRRQRKRTTVTRAGGRPRSPDRCPCGRWTLATATTRGHACAAVTERRGEPK